MSLTPPNKEWMTKPMMSAQYLEGVKSFITFAIANSGVVEDWFLCPCVKCRNVGDKKMLDTIADHLIFDGIDQSYKTWYFHGEALPSSSTGNVAALGIPFGDDQQRVPLRSSAMVGGSSEMSSQTGSVASSTHARKVVNLNVLGQPIGEHSLKLSTRIGELVRTHIPITYGDWRSVPTSRKDKLWDLLLVDFDIPQPGKILCVKAMSEAWRKHKAKLRKLHYDSHTNDADRLRNCPPTVGTEDWVEFVTQTSSPKIVELRKKNKEIRSNSTPIYHTTGRHGLARVEETMKRERANNEKPITRTDVWLRAHTAKDGSCPSSAEPKVKKIRELLSNQSECSSQDILNDPLTQMFGPDKRGRVRGVGTTVSRTQILNSAPAVDKLLHKDREVKKQQGDIENLKEEFASMRSVVGGIFESVCEIKSRMSASDTPTCERPSGSKRQFRGSSSTTLPVEDLSSSKGVSCELLNWTKNVVAVGKAIYESGPSTIHGRPVAEDDVKVIVDVIHMPDTPLPDPCSFASTLGDVSPGGYVSWPKSHIKHI